MLILYLCIRNNSITFTFAISESILAFQQYSHIFFSIYNMHLGKNVRKQFERKIFRFFWLHK